MIASRPALLAAALLLVAGSACQLGPPAKTISTDALVEELSGAVVDDYGIPALDVRCPKSRGAKAGDRFTCQVILDGGTLVMAVEQVDADGHLKFAPLQAVFPRARIAAAIASYYNEKIGSNVDVDCGAEDSVVAAAGDTITCTTADRAGAKEEVPVEITDLDGSFSFTVRGTKVDHAAPASDDPAGAPPAESPADGGADDPTLPGDG